MSAGAIHPLEPALATDRDPQLVVRGCIKVLNAISAGALVFIMTLTFIDVFMRYWFARPITGSSEMVMFAMAILVFSAFPPVTFREQHISVGILRGRLHGRALAVQRVVVVLVSLLACAAMAWQLTRDGQQLVADAQHTMVLELPLGQLGYFMGAMSGIAALSLFVLLCRQLAGGRPQGRSS